MTAPQPATPGSDSVRQQIAEVLRSHQQTRGMRVSMGWTCACGWWSKDQSPAFILAHQVDALVPLVDRLRAEAKAEALEEAADWLNDPGSSGAPETASDGSQWSLTPLTWVVRSLRVRAAAYRTNPSKETHRGE